MGQGLWGGDIGQGVSGTGAFGWVFLGWGIQVGVSGRDIWSGLLVRAGALGVFVGFSFWSFGLVCEGRDREELFHVLIDSYILFRLPMYICGRRKLVEWKKLYRSTPCLIPIPAIWSGTSF